MEINSRSRFSSKTSLSLLYFSELTTHIKKLFLVLTIQWSQKHPIDASAFRLDSLWRRPWLWSSRRWKHSRRSRWFFRSGHRLPVKTEDPNERETQWEFNFSLTRGDGVIGSPNGSCGSALRTHWTGNELFISKVPLTALALSVRSAQKARNKKTPTFIFHELFFTVLMDLFEPGEIENWAVCLIDYTRKAHTHSLMNIPDWLRRDKAVNGRH